MNWAGPKLLGTPKMFGRGIALVAVKALLWIFAASTLCIWDHYRVFNAGAHFSITATLTEVFDINVERPTQVLCPAFRLVGSQNAHRVNVC